MEPNTDEDGNAAGDDFPQVTPELREADMLKVAVLAPAQSQRDTRFLIYVYKARLKAMTDNARGFKKEAKNAVSAAEDASLHPTAAALVLKAHMEKNLRKGLAHLTGASQSATVLRPLILNNIGVIHHRLGRHALSVAYLTEAQSNFDRVLHATDGGHGGADPAQDAAEDAGKTTIYPESLPLWGLHRGPEVAYNLGVQYLMLKEFRKARQMFSIAAGHFARTSPRFWLRMAECFVGLAEERAKQYHDGLIESIVGKKSKRRAIIRSSGRGRNRMDMEMAMACAKAGLSVMSTMAAEGRGAGQASYEAPRTETHSLAPGDNAPAYEPSPDDRQRHDNLAVEAGLTLMLCFTCLECGRYEDVLAAGKRLVSLEDVPERLVNHAQTYMAKAECERGRVREALARLNPSNASDIEEKSRMWLNSAVIHLHLDQVDEARMATVQATETMNHQAGGKPTREMVLMNLYLAIREGNNGVARNILKSFEKVPVEADD